MSISVFLADDHTIVRDGLRYLLEAHGGIKVVGDDAEVFQAVGTAGRRCSYRGLLGAAFEEDVGACEVHRNHGGAIRRRSLVLDGGVELVDEESGCCFRVGADDVCMIIPVIGHVSDLLSRQY